MKLKLSAALIAGLILFLLIHPQAVMAEELAVVYVNPDPVELEPGETVTVEIRVENIEYLFAFALDIRFDPSKLTARNLEGGSFLASSWEPFKKSIDNVNGLIEYDITRWGDSTPEVSGSGILIKFDLEAKAPTNTTPLTISQALLSDRNGQLLNYDIESADVTIWGSVPDVYETSSDALLFVPAIEGVLSNDILPAGAEITAHLLEDVPKGKGELVWAAVQNGSFTYDPQGWSGETAFTYQACVVGGLCYDPVEVTLRVSTMTKDQFSFIPFVVFDQGE